MDYLLPCPHSPWIRTLPASALRVVSALPQPLAGPLPRASAATSCSALPQPLAGPLPRASAAAPPDTTPGTRFPGIPFPEPIPRPSPLLPAWPFPSPRVPPLTLLPAPSAPSQRATAEPRRVAARAGPLSHLPFYFLGGGGRWRSRAKSLSENCSPLKPYIGANSDWAEDLPTGLKTSRARP